MIKIDSFRLQKIQTATRPKKGNDGVKNFKDLNFTSETQGSSELHHVSSLSALAPLDELLQLQNIGNIPCQERTEENGKKILQELDKLRLSLLTGELSTSEIHHLSNIVRQNLSPARDPQLNLIIEEIEQRLAIEITKLEMSQT